MYFPRRSRKCSVDKCFAANELTKGGKDTLITSSLKQKDNFHQTIGNFGNFKYHDFCYTYYTSKDRINRHLKRVNEQSVDGPSAKRLSRPIICKMFNLKKKNFICGQYCEVTLIPKTLATG